MYSIKYIKVFIIGVIIYMYNYSIIYDDVEFKYEVVDW